MLRTTLRICILYATTAHVTIRKSYCCRTVSSVCKYRCRQKLPYSRNVFLTRDDDLLRLWTYLDRSTGNTSLSQLKADYACVVTGFHDANPHAHAQPLPFPLGSHKRNRNRFEVWLMHGFLSVEDQRVVLEYMWNTVTHFSSYSRDSIMTLPVTHFSSYSRDEEQLEVWHSYINIKRDRLIKQLHQTQPLYSNRLYSRWIGGTSFFMVRWIQLTTWYVQLAFCDTLGYNHSPSYWRDSQDTRTPAQIFSSGLASLCSKTLMCCVRSDLVLHRAVQTWQGKPYFRRFTAESTISCHDYFDSFWTMSMLCIPWRMLLMCFELSMCFFQNTGKKDMPHGSQW